MVSSYKTAKRRSPRGQARRLGVPAVSRDWWQWRDPPAPRPALVHRRDPAPPPEWAAHAATMKAFAEGTEPLPRGEDLAEAQEAGPVYASGAAAVAEHLRLASGKRMTARISTSQVK